MKRNPRERLVSRVSTQINLKVWETAERHQITYLELLEILSGMQARAIRLALKNEREFFDSGETDPGTEETYPESGSLDNTSKD